MEFQAHNGEIRISSSSSPVDRTTQHDRIYSMWGDVYVAEGTLGKGLFAARTFLPGEQVGIFDGPIIDFDAAVAKGDKQCYPLQIATNRYIDLEKPGCFANHSCEPNAGIRNDKELVAIKLIPAHVEIRYDYSTTMEEDFFTMPCRCDSRFCRKTVTDFKFLDHNLQREYVQLGLVMSFIVKRMGLEYRGSDGGINDDTVRTSKSGQCSLP